MGHGQGARDGGCTHHQHVRFLHAFAGGGVLGFAPQGQALLDPKTVLLIDDGQPQTMKMHIVLDDRMGADHQHRFSALDRRQHL